MGYLDLAQLNHKGVQPRLGLELSFKRAFQTWLTKLFAKVELELEKSQRTKVHNFIIANYSTYSQVFFKINKNFLEKKYTFNPVT